MKQQTKAEKLAKLIQHEREFNEAIWSPWPIPQVDMVLIPVSAQDAAMIRRIGPEKVRLVVPRDDGPTAIIKPKLDNIWGLGARVDTVMQLDTADRPVIGQYWRAVG
jgi:hypothetical protein